MRFPNSGAKAGNICNMSLVDAEYRVHINPPGLSSKLMRAPTVANSLGISLTKVSDQTAAYYPRFHLSGGDFGRLDEFGGVPPVTIDAVGEREFSGARLFRSSLAGRTFSTAVSSVKGSSKRR
jgi:hypothetical protein